MTEPKPLVHPALRAEAERLDAAYAMAELKLRQAYSRVSAFAFGAWMAADGVMFILSGPARLTSPVFAYASTHMPGWPWPFAATISTGGLLLVWASVAWRPLLGGIAYLLIAAWHLLYGFMVWHAIAAPLPPGTKPVSLSPIADHGALSAVAFILGLMLIKLSRRQKALRPVRQAVMRG